jgi:hypothetical protein
MANNISVAVEESETMLSGLASMVTLPLASPTSTGKSSDGVDVVVDGRAEVVVVATVVVEADAAAVGVAPDSVPQATAASRVRTIAILLMKTSSVIGG